MDVELNVGRPTAAKTRGSRKWVPMQLRSNLGIYRIGCRAYLIGPRLCFLAPGSGCLCVPLQNFNVRPSIFITTIFTTIISSPSFHQHLPNTICFVKREEKNATQLRYHATWGGSHRLLGPHQHVRLQVTHWTPHTT